MKDASDVLVNTKMLNDIREQVEASISVKKLLLSDIELLSQIELLADTCLKSLKAGGKLIFAGNGGSFADAQHISAEFTSRFMFDRAPLPSMALGTNNSSISAIGNDYGYEHVFARELEAIAKPEDVFIPISTSGDSINILAAVKLAEKRNILTIGLTGENGGQLKQHCKCLSVPSNETARIQECHILIGHILCQLVEYGYFKAHMNNDL